MIEVANWVPSNGGELESSESPIGFDVRSDSPFLRIIVSVRYPGLEFTEVAFSDSPSSPTMVFKPYFTRSSVDQVSDLPGWIRYRFVLRRTLGWLDSPEFEIFAFNTAGEEL